LGKITEKEKYNNYYKYYIHNDTLCSNDKMTELRFYVPTGHQTQDRSFWICSSQPISWLSTKKLNQPQQKQTCIRNKIYYNIKLTQKTKAWFGRLLMTTALEMKRAYSGRSR